MSVTHPRDPGMQDKIQTHYRQQLSALLDGALAPDEARFLLRRLQHDSELGACWERWELCGNLMRGTAQSLLPADFSQRVAAAIEADVAMATSQAVGAVAGSGRAASRGGWMRWGGGAALAASVAAVALLVSRQSADVTGPGSATPPTQVVASTPAPPARGLPASSPPAPSTPSPDSAASLAAAAVAVAEVPRRVARRNRASAPRAAVAAQVVAGNEGASKIAIADARSPQAAENMVVVDAQGRNPFVANVIRPARAWPRAVLPGFANGALNADYRGASSVQVPEAFEPFRPQLPADDAQQAASSVGDAPQSP